MDNKFEFSNSPLASVKDSRIEEENVLDMERFGLLLKEYRKRSGKKFTEIKKELNVSSSTAEDWGNAVSFPGEERLSEIARVYGIDFEELTRIFKISKKDRNRFVEARKSLKPS